MGNLFTASANGSSIATPVSVSVPITSNAGVGSDPTATSLWIFEVRCFVAITSQAQAVATQGDLPMIRFSYGVNIGGTIQADIEDWCPGGSLAGSEQHVFSFIGQLVGPSAIFIAEVVNLNKVVVSAVTIQASAFQVDEVPVATTTAVNVTVTPGSQHQVSRQQVRA